MAELKGICTSGTGRFVIFYRGYKEFSRVSINCWKPSKVGQWNNHVAPKELTEWQT